MALARRAPSLFGQAEGQWLSPEMFDLPGVRVCPHCGGASKKSGRNESGSQRRKCLSCGRTWAPFPADRPAGITSEQEWLIRHSFGMHYDLRTAGRRAGISAMTAHRIYHEMGREGTCKCGRSWNHAGRCAARRPKPGQP